MINDINKTICDTIYAAIEKKNITSNKDITYLCTVTHIYPENANTYQLTCEDTDYTVTLNNITLNLYDEVHLVIPQGDFSKKYVLEDICYNFNSSVDVTGTNKIVADSALSDTSDRPVQNKVIKKALDEKVDKIKNKGLSTNDFTDALKDKLNGISIDSELSSTSINPLQNKVIAGLIDILYYASGLNYEYVSDWNNITKSGLYFGYKTDVNKPPTYMALHIGVAHMLNKNRGVVIVYPYTEAPYNSGHFPYLRYKIDGSWGTWIQTSVNNNSKTSDGIVTKGDGNPNSYWGTNSNGNPDWMSVDDSLSDTSTNPIQNKAVNSKFEDIVTSINAKASVGSPEFTGTPKAPTPSEDSNNTQIATTAFTNTTVSNHNESDTAHDDIRTLINDINTRLNAALDSDDPDLDQISEIVAYIKSNRNLIDNITTSKVNVSDIIDSLTSTATNKPLSAKQGKVLNDLITSLTSTVDKIDKSEIPTSLPANGGTAETISSTLPISKGGTGQTTGEDAIKALINSAETGTSTPSDDDWYLSQWAGGSETDNQTPVRRKMSALWKYIKSKLHTVATSGNYNDLENTPSIPTKTSQLTNDSGFKTTDHTYSAGHQLNLTNSTFGLEKFCTTITNWDDATANGWYMAYNASNAPVSGWVYGIVIAYSSLYVRQIVWTFARGDKISNTNHLERIRDNGNWYDWTYMDVKTSYAKGVLDSTDGNPINITYGKTGQNSTDWLASWNGHEIGAISPSKLTVGKASDADTVGGKSTSDLQNYNNLTNKPTIPSVGNGTVTIKQAGTIKGSFTMNQSGDSTIELTDNNTTYSAATTTASGLMTASDKTKLNGIATNANNYSLPAATSSTRGGVKTGYSANGKNYPVQLSNEKMYVNVPWNDIPSGLIDGYVRTGLKSGGNPGSWSTAEGNNNLSTGMLSHAEGYTNVSSGFASHAGGASTTASGANAQALGYEIKATNHSSFACCKWSKNMTDGSEGHTQIGDAFVIGNGTSDNKRSNALRVTYLGDVLGTKAFQSSGADYAEFKKPWADDNPNNEDRVGYFVTIKNGLLYKANEGDYITGITSGNPSIVGNADEDYYWRYERDEFNRIILEDAPEIIQLKDEDGHPVFDEETHEPVMIETGNMIPNARMKFADDYDSSKQDEYIPREKRNEWDYVGMCGVIPVRDDGTCLSDHFCKCGQDGIATLATERGLDTFYVIERLSENVVSVDFK